MANLLAVFPQARCDAFELASGQVLAAREPIAVDHRVVRVCADGHISGPIRTASKSYCHEQEDDGLHGGTYQPQGERKSLPSRPVFSLNSTIAASTLAWPHTISLAE